MRDWLAQQDDPSLSQARDPARGQDARRRADVPRALGVDDRRRGRAEHDDAERVRAEHGLRDAARAGEAGARDPRGEHGRRQEAVLRVLPLRPRQDRDRRGVPHRRADRARPPHDRRRTSTRSPGRARTAPSPRACSRSRSRPRRRSPRSSPRRGRTSAWSARRRWRTAPRAASTAGCTRRSASRASRSGPSAAARRSRRRATGWRRSAAPARGKVYRLAQIVAAAALCLEISASAAMATAGSENFFRAHHERGGLR